MTNSEIILNAQCVESIKDYKLPVSIIWKLLKNEHTFDGLLKLYNEQRINIIKSYAKKDENGNVVEENEETVFADDFTRQQCINEINELLLQENDEIVISKVKLEELLSCDNNPHYDSFNMEQIKALSFMIEE